MHPSMIEGFKSYYVVWKLLSSLRAFFVAFGLNRTMQYGNDSVSARRASDSWCLNRTMQYGNTRHIDVGCKCVHV